VQPASRPPTRLAGSPNYVGWIRLAVGSDVRWRTCLRLLGALFRRAQPPRPFHLRHRPKGSEQLGTQAWNVRKTAQGITSVGVSPACAASTSQPPHRLASLLVWPATGTPFPCRRRSDWSGLTAPAACRSSAGGDERSPRVDWRPDRYRNRADSVGVTGSSTLRPLRRAPDSSSRPRFGH
jgi:hypothetical protein